MEEEYDPEIMIHYLSDYQRVYCGTHKELLAYTVKQYLLLAIKCGQPELVLKDPRFDVLFMEARLSTSCGWTSANPDHRTKF